MRTLFDFEIHSKYSRACSPDLTLPNIGAWAERKGVGIIGSGDFTHPKWFSEIKEQLEEDGSGLLQLKKEYAKTSPKFILSAEISSIYSHNGKTRRIHNILLAPNIETVSKIISRLEARGAKLGSDGRPIVGIPSKELLEMVLDVSEDVMLIPAHVWTPYFGLFGSMSGYDSVEDCFEDMSKYIYALETGLSADPEMFWRIPKFDRFTLVSCSDPHSLPRIARECNVFDLEPGDFTYAELTRIIKERDLKKFLATLEYFPEEGRYHFDGHRDCKVSMHPDETKKNKGICPVCGKKLTVGVLSRAVELADPSRPEGFKPSSFIPSQHFVVLEEILGEALGKGVASKAVQSEYFRMTNIRPEFELLLEAPYEDLVKTTSEAVARAIISMRQGKVEVIPGYDGEYGKIKLVESQKTPLLQRQGSLFE